MSFFDAAGEPAPFIMRHAQGDHWDLQAEALVRNTQRLVAHLRHTAEDELEQVWRDEPLAKETMARVDALRVEAIRIGLAIADALAEACYRPLLDFTRDHGIPIESNYPLTVLHRGGIAIHTGFLPYQLAPIALPPAYNSEPWRWPAKSRKACCRSGPLRCRGCRRPVATPPAVKLAGIISITSGASTCRRGTPLPCSKMETRPRTEES